MIKVGDAVSGAVAAALGVAVLLATRSFPDVPGEPGPAVFPRLAGAGLLLCGLVIAAGGLIRRDEAWIEAPAWLREPRHLLAVAIIVAGLAATAAFMESAGFFVCAGAMLLALLLALKVRAVIAFPVTIGAVALVHAIFYSGLRVALPWGVFERFAW